MFALKRGRIDIVRYLIGEEAVNIGNVAKSMIGRKNCGVKKVVERESV